MRLLLKKNLGEMVKTVPIWCWLLIAGFFTFFTRNIIIANDMAWYMNCALNIFSGKGYVDIDGSLILFRAPLFPLMIAVSYWLMGLSAWSAFWVIRIFAILSPVLAYFLGKVLYDRKVGLYSALLILSSYAMNYYSYRHLDHVWSLFIMLAIISIYAGLEKKSYIYFILSGVFIGAAYLTKEAAILLSPLPFLLWLTIKDYRNKKNFLGVLIYGAALIIVVLPWFYYTYPHTHDLKTTIFGFSGEKTAGSILGFHLSAIIKNYFIGMLRYYKGGDYSLSAYFSLAPLFILSWAMVIFKALRADKISIIFLNCFLLLSFYISYCGMNDFRLGQVFIFLILTYIVTVKFLITLVAFVYHKIGMAFGEKIPICSSNGKFVSVLIFALICLQMFSGPKKNIDLLKRSFFINLRRDRAAVGSGFNDSNKSLIKCLEDNVPAGSKIMGTYFVYDSAIYFLTQAKYIIYPMPFVGVYKEKYTYPFFWLSSDMPFYAPAKNNKVIFLSSFKDRPGPKDCFFYLTEEDLLSKLRECGVEYIFITTTRESSLSIYLEHNKSFEEIVDFDNGKCKIFKVQDQLFSKQGQPILVTNSAAGLMKYIKSVFPEKYVWYKENLFRNLFHWTEGDIEDIESGKYKLLVDVDKTY